jgi:hypothetical protein
MFRLPEWAQLVPHEGPLISSAGHQADSQSMLLLLPSLAGVSQLIRNVILAVIIRRINYKAASYKRCGLPRKLEQ